MNQKKPLIILPTSDWLFWLNASLTLYCSSSVNFMATKSTLSRFACTETSFVMK